MQLTNYTSSKSNYTWTGIRTRNQLWSYFRVTEPILVDSIDLYWGGYDSSTNGRHFIAEWNGDGKLGKIIVQSAVISVGQGRAWRSAKVKQTLLQPGNYAVGVWGDHLGRRIVGAWNGAHGGTTIYTDTNTSLRGNITGDAWRNKPGVIPARFNGEPPGHMKVKVGSTWRTGQAWVKVGSTWRKAKAVWVKVGSTWRRSR